MPPKTKTLQNFPSSGQPVDIKVGGWKAHWHGKSGKNLVVARYECDPESHIDFNVSYNIQTDALNVTFNMAHSPHRTSTNFKFTEQFMKDHKVDFIEPLKKSIRIKCVLEPK